MPKYRIFANCGWCAGGGCISDVEIEAPNEAAAQAEADDFAADEVAPYGTFELLEEESE